MASLGHLLDQLFERVAALEAKVGGSAVVAGAPVVSAPAAAKPAAASDSAQALAFDELINTHAKTFKEACDKIGGDVAVIGEVFSNLYKYNRKIIDMAAKCKKPTAEETKALVTEFQKIGEPLKPLREKRDQAFPNHFNAAWNALAGFQWVLVDVGPASVVENGRDSGALYADKVRRESKEKNLPDWMTWANSMRDGFTALIAFVTENYKMGLSWNGRGVAAGEYKGTDAATSGAGSSAAATTTAAATPAAAPAAAEAKPATPVAAGGDTAALKSMLFSQLGNIDQSSGKTAGLRHVTKDMKSTSKPADGSAAAVTPSAAATPKAAVSRADGNMPTGTPVCKLVDQQWKVEFQQGLKEPLHISEGVTIKHKVYIYACKDAVIFVDAKCTNVIIDNCRNVTVVVDSLLSGVEVVNCKKTKIQCNKMLPSVAIDKTDGCTVGLAWACRSAQIVTSKSSDMNVTFPVSEAEDADWIEQPIPEQFMSTITAENKVTTRVSELYSS